MSGLCNEVTLFTIRSESIGKSLCPMTGPTPNLSFDQRACFIAGQAKSGTTLVVALLDGHPELLVFPQDTAYFATALTKYGPRGRRAQFDYLTQQSWSKVLFGFEKRARKHDYSSFPREKLYQT